VPLGAELGGRGNPRSERDARGRILYRSIAQSAEFRQGLSRVEAGSERMRIAVMCTEHDPLNCHRGILISKILCADGVQVLHIHGDGQAEEHQAAERRLLRVTGLAQPDLFRTEEQVLAEAYDRQEARIAHVAEPAGNPGQRMRLYTIGFTKKSARGFFETLGAAGVARVVDVRLNNVSQLVGFAKKQDLPYFLDKISGIGYLHAPALAPTQEMLGSYKKHGAGWPAYERSFLGLMKDRRIETTWAGQLRDSDCLLRSEEQAVHCHRRLVAEYLTGFRDDLQVTHLG